MESKTGRRTDNEQEVIDLAAALFRALRANKGYGVVSGDLEGDYFGTLIDGSFDLRMVAETVLKEREAQKPR